MIESNALKKHFDKAAVAALFITGQFLSALAFDFNRSPFHHRAEYNPDGGANIWIGSKQA